MKSKPNRNACDKKREKSQNQSQTHSTHGLTQTIAENCAIVIRCLSFLQHFGAIQNALELIEIRKLLVFDTS